MATYSLSVTGASANNSIFQPKELTLPDANAITPGAIAQAARLGTVLQCKGPSGAINNFKVDAELSNFSSALYVLRRV